MSYKFFFIILLLGTLISCGFVQAVSVSDLLARPSIDSYTISYESTTGEDWAYFTKIWKDGDNKLRIYTLQTVQSFSITQDCSTNYISNNHLFFAWGQDPCHELNSFPTTTFEYIADLTSYSSTDPLSCGDVGCWYFSSLEQAIGASELDSDQFYQFQFNTGTVVVEPVAPEIIVGITAECFELTPSYNDPVIRLCLYPNSNLILKEYFGPQSLRSGRTAVALSLDEPSSDVFPNLPIPESQSDPEIPSIPVNPSGQTPPNQVNSNPVVEQAPNQATPQSSGVSSPSASGENEPATELASTESTNENDVIVNENKTSLFRKVTNSIRNFFRRIFS
jgi:hypothetical protein